MERYSSFEELKASTNSQLTAEAVVCYDEQALLNFIELLKACVVKEKGLEIRITD
jgi:hypothetical protein